MAINRFDTPAQAQFINTYSPLPFQELAAATQKRRGVLDDNLARLDAARAAADQLKYIPGSQDEMYIKNVTRTMDSIADQYIDKDLSDPEIYRKLRSEMRTKIQQGDINDIQSSYGAWAANQQNVAKLKASGKYHEALDQDPSAGYNTLTGGIYGHQTEARLDSRAAAEKFFNQINASSEIRPDLGVMKLGVGDEEIEASIAQNVGNFINTKEGEQAVRLAANDAGVDYNSLKQHEKEALATQYLRDVGQEFKYEQDRPLPSHYTNGQGGPDVNSWLSPTDNTASITVANLQDLKKGSQASTQISLIRGATAAGQPAVAFKGEMSKESKEKATSAWKKEVDEAKMKYGQNLGDIGDDEFIDIFNNAVGGLNNQSIGVNYITDDNITEQIKANIITGIGNRNFGLLDGHGTSGMSKLEAKGKGTLLKELGMNLSEFKEVIGAAPSLMFTQDGPEPGMYGISIEDKQGNPRTLWVSSGNKIQQMTDLSNQVNQKMRNLDDAPIPTSTHPINGRPMGLRLRPVLNPSSRSFDFNYELGYINDNTSTPGRESLTDGFEKIMDYAGDINTIKARELNTVVNSGVIGANFNYNTIPQVRERSASPFF